MCGKRRLRRRLHLGFRGCPHAQGSLAMVFWIWIDSGGRLLLIRQISPSICPCLHHLAWLRKIAAATLSYGSVTRRDRYWYGTRCPQSLFDFCTRIRFPEFRRLRDTFLGNKIDPSDRLRRNSFSVPGQLPSSLNSSLSDRCKVNLSRNFAGINESLLRPPVEASRIPSARRNHFDAS